MGVILRHFLRLTSPEMPPVFKDSGPRKGARGGEREFGIFAPVADEVEFILKGPAPTDLLRPRGPHCTSRAF